MNEHTEALVSWHEERHEVLNDHANDLAMQGFNKVAGENRVAANMHKSTAARLRELVAAESKAAILDRFLESLHAMLATSDTKSTPEVAALLDKVKELQLVRQQLATATALLGECEPFVACAGTTNLLTRIRAATKGKT